MNQNFFAINLSVWVFAFKAVLVRFWSWLILALAQMFFLAGGTFLLSVSAAYLLGFDSPSMCYSLAKSIDQQSFDMIKCTSWLGDFAELSPWIIWSVFIIGCIASLYALWLNFGVSLIVRNSSASPESFATLHLFRSILGIRMRLFWRIVLATFLIGVLVFLGFIFLIVPGIIFILRFVAVLPILADDPNIGVVASLRKSWFVTQGQEKRIFWFFIGFAVLTVSVSQFVLPLLSVVFFSIARFALYQELQSQSQIA